MNCDYSRPYPLPPYEKSPKIFSKLPPFISGSLWILLKLPLIKSDPRAQPFTARYEKSLNKVNKITLSLLPPPMVGKTCLFIVWCLLIHTMKVPQITSESRLATTVSFWLSLESPLLNYLKLPLLSLSLVLFFSVIAVITPELCLFLRLSNKLLVKSKPLSRIWHSGLSIPTLLLVIYLRNKTIILVIITTMSV